jgi:hypothetical protein
VASGNPTRPRGRLHADCIPDFAQWVHAKTGFVRKSSIVPSVASVIARLETARLAIMRTLRYGPTWNDSSSFWGVTTSRLGGVSCIDTATIEKVLNHVSGSFAGVVGIYQRHDFAKEKRAALDAWARHIQGLIDPATANVLPMRKGAR